MYWSIIFSRLVDILLLSSISFFPADSVIIFLKSLHVLFFCFSFICGMVGPLGLFSAFSLLRGRILYLEYPIYLMVRYDHIDGRLCGASTIVMDMPSFLFQWIIV